MRKLTFRRMLYKLLFFLVDLFGKDKKTAKRNIIRLGRTVIVLRLIKLYLFFLFYRKYFLPKISRYINLNNLIHIIIYYIIIRDVFIYIIKKLTTKEDIYLGESPDYPFITWSAQ